MSKYLKKLLFICIIFALLTVAFSIVVSAEGEKSCVAYFYYGDSLITYSDSSNTQSVQIYKEGETFTLPKVGSQGVGLVGWMSDDGVYYEKGASFTISRDITFYQIESTVKVSNEADLEAALGGWKRVLLTQDITIDFLNIKNWAISILDLGGKTITINSNNHGIGEERAALILMGDGKIVHTAKNTNNGFYLFTPHSYGDGSLHRFWIGKGVTIETNSTLYQASRDFIQKFGQGNYTHRGLKIYGNVTCPSLASTQGMEDMTVEVFDGATVKITSSDTALFRDTSSYTNIHVGDLKLSGGTIILPNDFKGLFLEENESRIDFEIGGGTFNIDIQKYISTDYKTQKNSDNTYSVLPNICLSVYSPNARHKYIATNVILLHSDGTVCPDGCLNGCNMCLNDLIIQYSCSYCSESYEIERFAFGHNYVTTQSKKIINNKKETVAGEFTQTCGRCGDVNTAYSYPAPKEAYITVKFEGVRNDKKYTLTVRELSTKFFGFAVDDMKSDNTETVVSSFSIQTYTHKFEDETEVVFTQSEIVAIEIPLGTTRVYGGGKLGVFYKNDHIREIYLPRSLEVIEENAFREMANLTTVTGVEYVSEKIGNNAFYQTSAHLIFDTLEINAKTVSDNAFRNVLATRVIIGENVQTINNAFPLDSEISNIEKEGPDKDGTGWLKEIFVMDFNNYYNALDTKPADFYGKSLKAIWESGSIPADVKNSMFSSLNTSTSLLTKANVYPDHNYDTVKHDPTCKEQGYTAYECLQCGLKTKSDFVSNEGITHVWERDETKDKAPTCSEEGYKAEYCSRCKEVRALEILPRDTTLKGHKFPSPTEIEKQIPDFNACEKDNWWYRTRCENGCGTWSQDRYRPGNGIVLGHAWSEDGIVQIEATCGSTGKSIKTCTRCALEDIVETPATGLHFSVKDDSKRVPPTCSAPGSNTLICTVCGLVELQPIPMLSPEEALELDAHNWVDDIMVEPTKKNPGAKRVICSLCLTTKEGYSYVSIPKLPDNSFPVWAIVLICVGGVAVLAGIGVTIFFTLFKKNKAAKNYKYKFNTFK